ncbi:SMP-30/gluconolactonase/LRE family protein [uncultured virus]|nr:SMP-30/gluconolactonase/LRE family protein [uncultured virus]
MSRFIIEDPTFIDLVGDNPKLIEVSGGHNFTEAPSYVSTGDTGYWFFGDVNEDVLFYIPWRGLEKVCYSTYCVGSQKSNQMPPIIGIGPKSFGKTKVYLQPAGGVNGSVFNDSGKLLLAEPRTRSVVKINGKTTKVLTKKYHDTLLNGPNDIITYNNKIYFTDNIYAKYRWGNKNYLPSAVYRYHKGQTRLVVGDRCQPNGLAFSPDGTKFYVSDSAAKGLNTWYPYLPHAVYRYDTSQDLPWSGKLFANIDVGIPDGLKVDIQGNIWVACGDGIQVFNSKGHRLGRILTPQSAANLVFGGDNRDVILITATSTVWAVKVFTQGAVPNKTLGFEI